MNLFKNKSRNDKFLVCLALLIFQVLFSNAQTISRYSKIIPKPVRVYDLEGEFTLNQNTIIETDNPKDKNLSFLINYISKSLGIETGLKPSIKKGNHQTIIELTSKGSEDLPNEGYKITVTPRKILIVGKEAGLFYAIQTLIQAFPVTVSNSITIPCVEIEDYPRFGYRGMMLDVSRHFFTTEEIKDLLDLMALYKLNMFHWHLTDDHGWRVEIKSLPKLTKIGAWRVVRYGRFGTNERPRPGELATDGGFYTQNEIKEIVQYAAERNIQVLPEIDVPGHAMAMIAAYPELSVVGDTSMKVNPGSKYGIWTADKKLEMLVDNTLNPTDEKVYEFLDKVFTEIAALFPYEYIHIGGDECYKGFWERDVEINSFMKKEGICNYEELQAYFTNRVNNILRTKNKKLIGWDEITNGALKGEVAVMNRFGEDGAIEQVSKKYKVIMAQGNKGLYFDYPQSNSDMEPSSHGYSSPIWKSYNYDPMPQTLTKEEQKYILGVQGCIWTEHIANVSKLQYMILPRILSLAKVGWGQVENKDLQFLSESVLPYHLERFDALGYNYWVPPVLNTIDTTMFGEKFTFDLKVPVKGSKIYFTVNGKRPGDTDHVYKEPLSFFVEENKSLVLQTLIVTPSGRRSVVTRVVMKNNKNIDTN